MASGTQLAQAVIDGLTTGATYAVIGMSFSVVWATVRTVNLALLQVLAAAGLFAYVGASHGVVLAFVYGLLAALVLGVGSHYLAVIPTVGKGQIYPIITSLGVGLLIVAGLSWGFGDTLRSVPSVLPEGGGTVQGVFIAWSAVILLSVVFVVVVTAAVIMRMTSIGLAFRTSALAPELSGAYGVNLGRVRLSSAFVAALLAGLAGIFTALLAGSVSPVLGATAGLKGMVAMLIGGAGNLPGAVVGGLAIGVIESVSAQYVSSALSGAVGYAVLFIVMVVRPSGLMKEY